MAREGFPSHGYSSRVATVSMLGSPSVSRREAVAVPVVYEGLEVGSLELATDDRALAKRVATLISHHVARLETGGAAASLSPEQSDGLS